MWLGVTGVCTSGRTIQPASRWSHALRGFVGSGSAVSAPAAVALTYLAFDHGASYSRKRA